ncbi:MAG TPA: pirin family protein [Cytophagaceae bacterium]|jgi:redox-sensitive bicupin YhaK (pirin superfamily)|nr:pirin family protein [Cytophagaceae bacterium]
MKKVIHRANTRGHADHGWLKSFHTFSFAGYYDPERTNFGLLRVLNDDVIEGGKGFGKHPHDNMEIISIPIFGAIAHKDSTGRDKVINTNDVQIMSAGRGIAHSEFNASATESTNFLQIWVFPKEEDIEPRYDQKTFDPSGRKNKFQIVVSPKDASAVWINQDAYFSLGNLDKGIALDYKIRKTGNGVYAFVINGEVKINNEVLQKRDAIGLSELDSIHIEATADTEVLLMEVPMN